MSSSNVNQLGDQFAKILNGKPTIKQNGCSVSLKRQFQVRIQGRPSESVLPVGISFESLDQSGQALNLGEVTVLEQEIPQFVRACAEQGLIVGAIHNHWIFAEPFLMYVHVQSVEPPLEFAQKMVNAFTTLSSAPVQEKSGGS